MTFYHALPWLLVILALVVGYVWGRKRHVKQGDDRRLLNMLSDANQWLDMLSRQALVGCVVIRKGQVAAVNPLFRSIVHCAAGERLEGRPFLEMIPAARRAFVETRLRECLEGRSGTTRFMTDICGCDGQLLKIEAFAARQVLQDEVSIILIVVDQTRMMRDAQLMHWKNVINTAYAQDGDLWNAMTMVNRAIEDLVPDCISSVLRVDEHGKLHQLGDNQLDEGYNQALEGLPVGPRVGSCGTAAFRKQRVVVDNIALDPLWKDYHELALRHGLMACWSTPVMTEDRVLATFALYYKTERRPQGWEMELIDRLATQIKILIVQDDTRNRLRQSQRRLSEAERVARMSHFVWYSDPDVLEWTSDPGFLPSGDGLPPQNLEALIACLEASKRAAIASAFAQAAENMIPASFQVQLEGSPEATRTLQMDLRPESKGQVFVVLRDISDLWQAKSKVEQAKLRLEEQVRERTHELELANRELKAFSYSVSHDLRAPLRAISGFAERIQALLDEGSEQEVRELLQRIQHNVQTMSGLIDDLLRLSRVSQAELEPELVHLGDLARNIVEEKSSGIEDGSGGQVVFECGDDLQARCDGNLVRVALENMLDNAIKYSRERDTCRIRLDVVGESDGHKVFCVTDNGVGFPSEEKEQLFEAFKRCHHGDEYPGTGIGLATVKRVIERHGGKVWAESELGEGARFYFTLPSDQVAEGS
jgi:signal transduction histidine kinase